MTIDKRIAYKGQGNPFYGKKHSEVSLKKQSESKIGKKNPMYGKHITEKHKQLLSKLKKGVPRFDIIGNKNPSWNGGYEPYYGPNWNYQRTLRLELDKHSCQKCGKIENDRELDIHHIIPFRKFGREKYLEANDINNLITLCMGCHRKVEHGVLKL